MPTAVPEMSLSHGQVLWALARAGGNLKRRW